MAKYGSAIRTRYGGAVAGSVNPEKIDQIFKRLCVFVRLSCWHMPDVFNGLSAEDLPSEVLLSYLESPNGLGWDPLIGPLDKFLLVILRNKMIDHLRRQKHTAGSLDDPVYLQQIANSPGNQTLDAPEPHASVPTDWKAQDSRVDDGNRDLNALRWALEDIDDFSNINQKLAKRLKTTPSDIVNLKKRLARKFPRNG